MKPVTDRKETVYLLFYLPLHHSALSVGISALFHSLQPTSSLGAGKHEQDCLLSSANSNWDGKFNCMTKKKKMLRSIQKVPQQSTRGLKYSVYCRSTLPFSKSSWSERARFKLRLAGGSFCWFCLRKLKEEPHKQPAGCVSQIWSIYTPENAQRKQWYRANFNWRNLNQSAQTTFKSYDIINTAAHSKTAKIRLFLHCDEHFIKEIQI